MACVFDFVEVMKWLVTNFALTADTICKYYLLANGLGSVKSELISVCAERWMLEAQYCAATLGFGKCGSLLANFFPNPSLKILAWEILVDTIIHGLTAATQVASDSELQACLCKVGHSHSKG